MAKNTVKAGDGEGFLRAFTDAWKDLEAGEDVHLAMKVFASNRKGVITVELSALYEDDMNDTRVAGAYQCDYPTAQVGSLEAALYRAVVQLDRVVYEARKYPSGRG